MTINSYFAYGLGAYDITPDYIFKSKHNSSDPHKLHTFILFQFVNKKFLCYYGVRTHQTKHK